MKAVCVETGRVAHTRVNRAAGISGVEERRPVAVSLRGHRKRVPHGRVGIAAALVIRMGGDERHVAKAVHHHHRRAGGGTVADDSQHGHMRLPEPARADGRFCRVEIHPVGRRIDVDHGGGHPVSSCGTERRRPSGTRTGGGNPVREHARHRENLDQPAAVEHGYGVDIIPEAFVRHKEEPRQAFAECPGARRAPMGLQCLAG